MIEHDYQFIFVHILKTAGTSIEQLFCDFPTDQQDVAFKHSGIDFYYQQFPREAAEYFKFTFVRNPWDRLVSQYQWRLFKRYQDPNQSFAEWLESSYEMWQESQLRMISINNEIKMDFIGKFENLQEDWHKICDILGVHNRTLPHLNDLSNRPHYTNFYHDHSRKLVAAGCRAEIEHFNYAF